MRIAIASGKGGAGKTTVTASLASVWEGPFIAVDADVEAPNLHLFLPPRLEGTETVGLEVPILESRALHTLRGLPRHLPLQGHRPVRVTPDHLPGHVPRLWRLFRGVPFRCAHAGQPGTRRP